MLQPTASMLSASEQNLPTKCQTTSLLGLAGLVDHGHVAPAVGLVNVAVGLQPASLFAQQHYASDVTQ